MWSLLMDCALQQQGMNGALARMLGLSGPLPNAAASDEASLSDCSNSVEDPDELRAALRVKAELGDEARRLSGGSGGSGSGITLSGAERINGHHTIGGLDHLLQAVQQQQQQQQLQLEHVKQSPSPLPLPPGVSLEPVQKMTISQTPPSAASLARRTPTPSGSHLSQHLHHSSQSSQSSQNAVTLNGFHLPQQQHQQQQIHHRETHTPSNHPHPQQQRLHRSTLAHGGQLYANGGARQRSSTSELSVSGQMNTRTTVNGVSTKRRRDFDSEPNDSSENLVEKRTFYKEMTKLCGTVQNLVESMRETHHLKQRVLLEKLRLVRMREAALVAQAQRDSLVEKEAASRILPENSNDAPQENLKAIDDIGEEEDHHGDELIEESTARSKDGSQEDSASSKDIEPSSAERQLLPDIEEKMDDFDEDLSRDEGKGKDEGLGIGIMLDEDDENDLDTSKRVTKEEAPETEEE